MAQFDVLRSARSATYPLVLDVQADVHSSLASRVVVPLVPRLRAPTRSVSRLTPVVSVRGDDYVAMFPLLASVPRAALGEIIASLTAQRATLLVALELLVTGS